MAPLAKKISFGHRKKIGKPGLASLWVSISVQRKFGPLYDIYVYESMKSSIFCYPFKRLKNRGKMITDQFLGQTQTQRPAPLGRIPGELQASLGQLVSPTIFLFHIHTCQVQFLHIIPNHFQPGFSWPLLALHSPPPYTYISSPNCIFLLHMTKPPQPVSLSFNTFFLPLCPSYPSALHYSLSPNHWHLCSFTLLFFSLKEVPHMYPPNHSTSLSSPASIPAFSSLAMSHFLHHAASDTVPIDFTFSV